MNKKRRVKREYAQLLRKIKKLVKFLGSEKSNILSEEAYDLLWEQKRAMERYLDVLEQQLEAWEDEK